MNDVVLWYFLNGLVILMIGLVGGFPFAKSIKKQNGKEVAWRVVHSGASMGGVMLIAIGMVVKYLPITPVINWSIFSGFIISTYALVIGMVIAAITGARGLGRQENNKGVYWKVVYSLYGLGSIFSIIATGCLIILCLQSLLK